MWRFICRCNDGSAFFEHKVTGELMNWYIKPNMSYAGIEHFNIDPEKWVAIING